MARRHFGEIQSRNFKLNFIDLKQPGGAGAKTASDPAYQSAGRGRTLGKFCRLRLKFAAKTPK
jgi:hypothetical protein